MGVGEADVVLRDDVEPLAITVANAGIPFALTGPAAAVHASRCLEALASLGPGDSLLHVKLLVSRAVVLVQSHDEGADTAAASAGEMAARLGDDHAHAYALVARSMANPMPEHADSRLAAAREILDIAACKTDDALVPIGYLILLVALLEKGEIRSLDIELTGRGEVGARFPGLSESEPARWFRSLRAILDGDTTLAEMLVEQQLAAVGNGEDPHALAVYTAQMGIIRWMQGRVDGAEDAFLAARRAHPEQLLWSASLAWLWLRQGRRAAAESLFGSLQDLDEIPRDRYWLSTLTVMAEVATQLGSRAFAEEIHRRLVPFADRLVPVGVGVAFWGTAARSLGLLEERLGMLAEARAHLEQAVTMTSRVGAQAWLAEAQIELAEFAIRNDIGDIPAYDLLTEAMMTCTARGFAALRVRASQRPRIRVMGRFEVVSHNGVKAEWTSRKARELLKMLVAARGVSRSREVYMDALWSGIDPARLVNRFSVAVSAIRGALDPERSLSREQYVVVEGDSIRLDLDNVDVDLERFLAVAQQPDEASRRVAAELYRGGAFPDEPYADWAVTVRDHAHHVWSQLGESQLD